jgi:hypothetical protein
MKDQRPNDWEAIADALHGDVEGEPNFLLFLQKDRGDYTHEDWEQADKAREQWIAFYLEQLRASLGQGQYDLYVFEFEDHDQESATLERGDTFRQAPHVTIRNH